MKKSTILIITLWLFIFVPTIVFAASDSSGEQGGSAGIVNSCSPNCVGMQRSSSLAGVRITFVDSEGKAVSASNGLSFDFETYIGPGKAGLNTHYNAYNGDRNKVALASGGNYTEGFTNERDIKKFSAVAAAYNKYVPIEGSNHYTTLKTSGNTGGNLNGMGNELDFFLSLTKSGNPTYAADVNAFIRAIAEVSGGFNADDLIYKIAEGCNTGEEIFIVMEPLFFWSGKINNAWQNYFGSLADSYHFFNGKVVGGLWNINNQAYLIHYERELSAYNGAQGVAAKGFNIQSGADLLSTAGFAIAVDWANDPGEYCNACSYSDGKFSYDNKVYPGDLVIPSKYGSIQDFAFSNRGEGGAGCCALLKPQINSMPAEWQEAYNRLCDVPDKDDPECCNPGVPLEPEIDVNNCCTDGTVSSVAESELDDIFCYDSELKVDFYKDRCENDKFKNKINDYCDLYCTERVTMEVPGAITAVSGRYFELSKTSYGTTSPYIEGYRRCRVKIYYNEWRDKYVEKVDEEVKQYNEFQKQSSMKANYDDAIGTKETITKTGKVTASCSETDPVTNKTKSNSATESFSYTYYKYTFANKHDYYTVSLSNDKYSRVEIVNGSKKKESHEPYSLYKYADALKAYNEAKDKAAKSCGYGNVTYKGDSFDTQNITSYRDEDPESVVKEIEKAISVAKSAYEIATKDAYKLEQNIDECDFYFDDSKSRLGEEVTYSSKDASKNYEFSPDLLFRYSEVYLGSKSEKVLDKLAIEFDRECNSEIIYDENETGVDEIKPDRYSGVYGNGSEKMHDFNRNVTIAYESNFNLSKYYDNAYSADKKHSTDAKYHTTCKWTEKEKNTYTLVPSGIVSGESSTNHTIHNQEYRINLTTLDGTYETYWDIEGIGHKGRFTDYFKKGGTTCSNQLPSEAGTTITCKLHVEHELITTGTCNGTEGSEVTINPEDCDELKEGYDLFNFKIVDPADLFPGGTTTATGTIGYNWTMSPRGQDVMKEITDKAATSSTYAPENISYSVNLSPKDLKNIKNYNKERESNNQKGYSDFNLHCECPTEVQTGSLINGVGCTQCKSYFMENLENGIIRYGNTDHRVNVWASPKRLQEIREDNTLKRKW